MKQVAEFDLTVMVGKQNRGSERAGDKCELCVHQCDTFLNRTHSCAHLSPRMQFINRNLSANQETVNSNKPN